MRNMRKFYITFVSIMTIAIILPNLTAFASFKPPEEPSSEAIYMVNIGSDFDTPILEVNKDEKRQPAITCKNYDSDFTPRASRRKLANLSKIL